MKALFRFMSRHPWMYVVLAFVLLIAFWAALIVVAARHPNPEFKVPPPPKHVKVSNCENLTAKLQRSQRDAAQDRMCLDNPFPIATLRVLCDFAVNLQVRPEGNPYHHR